MVLYPFRRIFVNLDGFCGPGNFRKIKKQKSGQKIKIKNDKTDPEILNTDKIDGKTIFPFYIDSKNRQKLILRFYMDSKNRYPKGRKIKGKYVKIKTPKNGTFFVFFSF